MPAHYLKFRCNVFKAWYGTRRRGKQMFFCYKSWQYYGASCSISNQPLYVVIMQSQRTYGKHKVGIGDVFSSKTIARNQTSGLSQGLLTTTFSDANLFVIRL